MRRDKVELYNPRKTPHFAPAQQRLPAARKGYGLSLIR
jgi:hypothetical protein